MSMMPMDNKPKTVSFYDPKSEAEAKRKRQLAEILVQQGNAPVKNEMAGGMTVERSPWENINQGAQKYMGEFKLQQADDKQAELDLNRQQMMADALSKFEENPQEAAMMLAQDPRYSDMAAKILQGEVDYGRKQERFAVEDAFKQRQLDLMAQRATTGGSTPAAMQVANRMYELQTIASDPNRTPEERLSAQTQYNLIGQAQKTYNFTRGSEKNFMGDLSNLQNQGMGQTDIMGQPNMGGFADIAGDGAYNIADETNLPPLQDNMMVDPTQVTPNNQMPQPATQPMPVQPVVRPIQGFGETQANFEGQKETAKSRAKYMEEGRQMLPKAQRALQSAEIRNQNISRVSNQIAQDAQEAFTTGFTGSIMGAIAGTPAFDLKNNLQTLEATAAFDTLQTMRDNSPTGGALGQVTERELDLLKAQYSNLVNSQSYEQFMDNLKAFNMQNQAAMQAARLAYEQDYNRFGGAQDQFLPSPQSMQQTSPQAQPQIAVNPQTGERLINRGNGWEPYNGQ